MARRAETAPHISPRLIESLGDLLGELRKFDLTLAPIRSQKPDATLSFHNFVPNVAPFSGSLEQDVISVDQWRIGMRMKLAQMDQILDQNTMSMDRFKANYVLSMLTGWAWLVIEERRVVLIFLDDLPVKYSRTCVCYQLLRPKIEFDRPIIDTRSNPCLRPVNRFDETDMIGIWRTLLPNPCAWR